MSDTPEFETADTPNIKVLKRRGRAKATGTRVTDKPTAEELDKLEMKRDHEQRGTGNRSWEPPNFLAYHDKDPNYAYKFIKQTNIDMRKQEGWEIVQPKAANKAFEGRHLLDGTPMANTIVRNELVLMRMPREMADQRNKYYQDLGSNAGENHKRQFRDSLSAKGIRTYDLDQK